MRTSARALIHDEDGRVRWFIPLVIAFSLVMAGVALADNVVNDVEGDDVEAEAGATVIVNFRVVGTAGTCGIDAENALTLTWDTEDWSAGEAGVGLVGGSPQARTFTQCGVAQAVSFSVPAGAQPGDILGVPKAEMTGNPTALGAIKNNNSHFTITVVAPAGSGCEDDYTVTFGRPLDEMTSSDGVVNTIKNGRVVPVKVTIFDNCAGEYVTDPETIVRIKLPYLGAETDDPTDPVQQYASAGAANTDSLFRWSDDGFWIYNLNTKIAGLQVGNIYRIDVYVGGAKATDDEWAEIQPVK